MLTLRANNRYVGRNKPQMPGESLSIPAQSNKTHFR